VELFKQFCVRFWLQSLQKVHYDSKNLNGLKKCGLYTDFNCKKINRKYYRKTTYCMQFLHLSVINFFVADFKREISTVLKKGSSKSAFFDKHIDFWRYLFIGFANF